jgi:hypothetical protein
MIVRRAPIGAAGQAWSRDWSRLGVGSRKGHAIPVRRCDLVEQLTFAGFLLTKAAFRRILGGSSHGCYRFPSSGLLLIEAVIGGEAGHGACSSGADER